MGGRCCRKASVEAVLPLWERDREEIVKEFISLGFKAKIVLVDASMLDKRFLGQDLSYSLLKEIESLELMYVEKMGNITQ